MRAALTKSEFVLHYQPQLDLKTGKVIAVEALIRWAHPALGLVSPSQFIPAAEQTGLIAPIGEWVIREACHQNKAWQDAGLPQIKVCANVSAQQFRARGLVSSVLYALGETGLDAQFLEFELTESLIMQDVGQAIAAMKELQEIGIAFSIDDFGTGYSSLAALRSFPVSRLKIDKSFIEDLDGGRNGHVASAIISLGRDLNLRIVAEGVETEEQLRFLRVRGCDEIQGFLFCKPLPASEVARFLGIDQPGGIFGAC